MNIYVYKNFSFSKKKKEYANTFFDPAYIHNGYFYGDANGSRFGRNSVFYPEARALSKHRVASAPAAVASQQKGGCNGVDKEKHRSEFVTRVIADSQLVRPMPNRIHAIHAIHAE